MRILATAIMMPLAACSFNGDSDEGGAGIKGSGTGTSRSYAVADFSAVDLRGADDVDVRVGTGYSVRAEGDAETLDRVRIERDGDTLKIGRRSGSGFRWGKGRSARIFVTLPRLARAEVSGSGNLAVDRVEGARFAAGVAGSGGLAIAALRVDAAELSLAGSGDLTATGTARQLEINIAGSGNIDAPGLKADGAKVSITGSGGARATVNGTAEVSMTGSGDVDLGGGARCTVSKMGSGSVRCGG